MSENKFMTEAEIASLSVSALSNRPNEQSGQYGRKGLNAEELKSAFSALPEAIARRLNERLPEILSAIEETRTDIAEGDEALREAIMEAVSELNGDLKEEVTAALGGKVDKINQTYLQDTVTYVYGVGKDGGTKLIKGNFGGEGGTLVYRDESGYFAVKNPNLGWHPVSKSYFDSKANNSLYGEFSDMEKRMRNFEYSASGNIYRTETLRGSASAIQVDNACPYGILSRIGGNVAKVTVGLPFDTAGTVCHTSGVNVTENVSPNSVSIPVGEKYNIKIPCDISSPCDVSVYASERGAGYLNKGGLMDSGKSQIGSQVTFREGVSELSLDSGNAKYVCITKTGQGTALTEACCLDDIRVMVSDPTKAEIMRLVDEIEIPAEIRALDGYGLDGAYVDFGERKFYSASGTATDITKLLPIELDVISLLPSVILKFTDASGNAVAADYELSYKNKI